MTFLDFQQLASQCHSYCNGHQKDSQFNLVNYFSGEKGAS
jgi:hypothetical protein